MPSWRSGLARPGPTATGHAGRERRSHLAGTHSKCRRPSRAGEGSGPLGRPPLRSDEPPGPPRSLPTSRPGGHQRHGPVTAHASVTAASLLSAHGHQRPSHHTRELSPGFADTEAQSFLQSQSEVGHQEVRSPFSNESRFRVLGTSTVASPLFAADGPLQLREATMLSTVPGGSRF